MLKQRVGSTGKLERAVARYEAKLARAGNPTQRQYASSMLGMASNARAEAQADGGGKGAAKAAMPDDPQVVTLHPGEYSVGDG